MTRVQQLRRKVNSCGEWQASPPTATLIDQDLVGLAYQLEEEADAREEYLKRQSEADKPA